MKRTAALCLSLLLFPYLFTLAWTGRAEGMIQMGRKRLSGSCGRLHYRNGGYADSG